MTFDIASKDVAHIVEAGDYTTGTTCGVVGSSPEWWSAGIDEERMTRYEWVAYHKGTTDCLSLINVLWYDAENSKGYHAWVSF